MSKYLFVRAIIFVFLTFVFKFSVAQNGRSFRFSENTFVSFSVPRPHDFYKVELLMKKGVRMVYTYSTKGKYIDSELVVTKYFDSTGLCLERDDYEAKKLVSITNYTYLDKQLTMIHILTSSGLYNDIMITYDYDEAGNKTGQKTYSKYALDTTAKYEFRAERKWEYDSLNHLSSLFDSKNDKLYLSSKYYYSNDTLRLVEHFDENKKLKSTEYYDYDAKSRMKKIYGRKNKKDLQQEFFYDAVGNFIKEIDYNTFRSDDINTLSFTYSDDFLISEAFHSKYDEDINFKCYYFPSVAQD